MASTFASTFDRIEKLALSLPEAVRKDIEAWGGEPTFRVRDKNFVFSNPEGTIITVKLPKEEAAAVVETVDGGTQVFRPPGSRGARR